MRTLLIICAFMTSLWCAQARADVCEGNFWQPTFVHDVEQADGPWFVSPLGFLKLQGDSSTWVNQACDLIRANGVRDELGFTSCQEYTRIQCGCSRQVPGNRTCDAFLATRPLAPGGAAATGGTQTMIGPGGLAPPPAMGALEYETNRGGSDLNDPNTEAPASNAAACSERCRNDPRCKSFTWVRPGVQGPDAHCWVKDAVPSPTSDSCCISGVKEPAGHIVVVQATYGASCGAPVDVIKDLADHCEGQPQCSYLIDHRVLGDPAVGCVKDYSYGWQCEYGSGQQIHTGFVRGEASGQTASLTCN